MPRVANSTSCCGHAMIAGFSSGLKKDQKEAELASALESISGVTNQARRWVELILAGAQETDWGPTVRSFGFQLICSFDNSSGSICYVYGMVTGNGFYDKLKENHTPLMTENAPTTFKATKKEIPNPFKRGSFWR